jgi:hypothetical protein
VTAAGATVKEPAHDVGGGRLVATVTDPDGNVLGLRQDRSVGRRGAAGGHADGQPDRQDPGCHPNRSAGLGHTRDVSNALATPHRWFRISPGRIQAWREVNELPDRELMRDSRWLV